jgi:hypothetical protein
MPEVPSTHSKALELNLDSGRYGSIAEIGAGQEVGRWFFRVGAAAGTIAKTMSAYDKEVSDAIYGTAARYVSSARLQSMLDHEYDLLIERLDEHRGRESRFFAFADTVTAQNFQGDADCQGWMGIRFQTHPKAASSEIILHARMLDRDALAQHEALGILGVNLIYGASRLSEDPESLLASLLDNLGNRRIEIDMIEFRGAAFRNVDHRITSLRLVEHGLSRAAMISASGEVLRPSEVLYKKSVVLQRGRFRPPTSVHSDIQRRASEMFQRDSGVDSTKLVSILEIALSELQDTEGPGLVDFLDRIDALNAGNQLVLLSDLPEQYLVAEFLAHYSVTQIALPVGALEFREVLNEDHYKALPGGILEASGRLFGINVRIYVYPSVDPDTDARVELNTISLPDDMQLLFDFLSAKGYVRPLDGLGTERLRIRSDDVLGWLESGDSRWESCVDAEVVAAIKSRGLFGFSE